MPQGQIEDIKKNTGTVVPTEVSAQTVNPVQQPNININKTDVNAVQQWTQTTNQTNQVSQAVPQAMQQPQAVWQTAQIQSSSVWTPDLKITELNQGQTWASVATQWLNAMMDLNDLKNTDTLLNELMQWYPIYGNWMAVDSARERYNNYKALSGMSYREIWDTILSGEMAKNWTAMSDLYKYNPQLFQQVRMYVNIQEDVNNLNKLWENLYNNYNNVETNSNYLKQTIQQEDENTKSIITTYSDDIIDFIKSYSTNATELMSLASSMLNNPTIQQYKNNILELEGQIANINTDIAYVWDEARNMLGSSAPESLVSAYISQQTKHLQRQLMTYQNSLLVEQGKLDNAVDDVKTQLDYYAKGMDMWIDALKALMWGSTWSSSSKKSSTADTTTEELVWWLSQEAVKSLRDALVNWELADFELSATTLKKYWLDKTSAWTLWKYLAQWLWTDDLLAIKKAYGTAEYQKVLWYWIEEREADLVNLLKWIEDLEDMATWLNKFGISEKQGKSLMEKAWFGVDAINEVWAYLWWWDITSKVSGMEQPEVKSQAVQDAITNLTKKTSTNKLTWEKETISWVVPYTYAEQINKSTWMKRKVSEKWKNAYTAIMNWSFNATDKTAYWFAKDDTRAYMWSQIWANCTSYNDVQKAMKNIEAKAEDFTWNDPAKAKEDLEIWIRQSYFDTNRNIWLKAIETIKDKSTDSTIVWNLKMYLIWVMWPTYNEQTVLKTLVEQAWVKKEVVSKLF